jgi:hypothetical protein
MPQFGQGATLVAAAPSQGQVTFDAKPVTPGAEIPERPGSIGRSRGTRTCNTGFAPSDNWSWPGSIIGESLKHLLHHYLVHYAIYYLIDKSIH